jgi:hypothetical protein
LQLPQRFERREESFGSRQRVGILLAREEVPEFEGRGGAV